MDGANLDRRVGSAIVHGNSIDGTGGSAHNLVSDRTILKSI
jgi:hypothetical protein